MDSLGEEDGKARANRQKKQPPGDGSWRGGDGGGFVTVYM